MKLTPTAVAPIVVGTVFAPSGFWDDVQAFWVFVLHQHYFNELSPAFYFPVMFTSESWEWAPLIMLVALSIISGIPKEVFEAADLSGATAFQKFRMIILPTIFRSTVMQFVVVLRFIDAMRAFEIPLAWSNWLGYTTTIGSPARSTMNGCAACPVTLALCAAAILLRPAAEIVRFGFGA